MTGVQTCALPISGHLHAAVGRPRAIYLLYPWKGEEVLCRGAILPYFEFVDPARLTDDEWCRREIAGPLPGTPPWLGPILGEKGLGKPEFRER